MKEKIMNKLINLNDIVLRKAKEDDLEKMASLWNEVQKEDNFYKPFTKDEYINKMMGDPNISLDNINLAFHKDKLVSFLIIAQRKGNNNTIYINALLTKKEYRNIGIASKLLDLVEKESFEKGFKEIVCTNFLPSCYAWYIPNTDKHDHPCAPGIRINSSLYLFLLHKRYVTFAYQDAFHLNLSDYEISPKIQKILDENLKDGFKIELYGAKKHKGMEEFLTELKSPDFERVIRENLSLVKPYPFLVITKDNKICGWTGAMWNEASGRGHFDGIANLESVRGRGLGKALFSLLALYSKNNGAKFMTFYTGLTNYARNIYMDSGFKIVQSFCAMKKELKG